MASIPNSFPPDSSPQLSPSRSNQQDDLRVTEPTATSTTPEDIQPVVVEPPQEIEPPELPRSAPAPEPVPEYEPRHCWICLQDEGDDPTNTSTWRSPCPCILQAHEECLLDWISDMESNNKVRFGGKVYCPQCKSEIHIARPKDYIVVATESIRRSAGRMILPTALAAGIGCLWSGSMVYGVNAIHLVFGTDHAQVILAETAIPKLHAMIGERAARIFHNISRITDPFMPAEGVENWKTFLGLPMIAPVLILSRTNLADYGFHLASISYLISHRDGKFLHQWPPTPAFAFSMLPYIRWVYGEIYYHSFYTLIKQWEHAIQRKPREGETAEQVAQEAERERLENEDEGVLEIGLEVVEEEDPRQDIGDNHPAMVIQDDARLLQEIMARRNRGNEAVRPLFQGNGQGIEQLPRPLQAGDVERLERLRQALMPDAQVNQAPLGPADAQLPPVQPQANRPRRNPPQGADDGLWEFHQNINLRSLATAVMGALFFPAVSSVMGEVLKYSLPRRLIMRPMLGVKTLPATGLLQDKWGRSMVGGALFIVLKDAVMLYCKWRKAKNHGMRTVVDYSGKRKTGH